MDAIKYLGLIVIIAFGFTFKSVYALDCPAGTQYKSIKNKKVDFPAYGGLYWGGQGRFEGQLEEYCEKDGKKNGPYKKWGPNGELEDDGFYDNDAPHGKWETVIPSQIQHKTYDHGKIVNAKTESPKEYVIDFEKCIPHGKGIPVSFGSSNYKLLGIKDGNCQMVFGGEVEMGKNPDQKCMVPTHAGKLTFHTNSDGLDIGSIQKYCVKEPK